MMRKGGNGSFHPLGWEYAATANNARGTADSRDLRIRLFWRAEWEIFKCGGFGSQGHDNNFRGLTIFAPVTRLCSRGGRLFESGLIKEVEAEHAVFIALRHRRPLFAERPLHAHD